MAEPPPPPPSNASSSSSFSGGDFSNNLLSDLAPLLTLFREQVTKQFLSLSMGWAGNVLIAIGPLGIMSILVSAIRVGGMKRLKALIGRARESGVTAEAKLLSSTSVEVCEMWIVRAYGSPRTIQLVILFDSSIHEWTSGWTVLSLGRAYKEEVLIEASGKQLAANDVAFTVAPNLTLYAPGLIGTATKMGKQLGLGLLLQTVALASPAIVMHQTRWSVSPYGYACYATGTVMIGIGLALCSRIIEGSTTELELVPNPKRKVPLHILTVRNADLRTECETDTDTLHVHIGSTIGKHR